MCKLAPTPVLDLSYTTNKGGCSDADEGGVRSGAPAGEGGGGLALQWTFGATTQPSPALTADPSHAEALYHARTIYSCALQHV